MLIKQPIKVKLKVAVVVTCHHNYLKYLSKVLRSINHQTTKFDQKILVLDGCSIPSNPIDWTVVEVDYKNPNASRNAGLEKVNSQWVVHWDGDNLMASDFLEKHIATLDENSDNQSIAFFYPSISYRSSINLLSVADDSREVRTLIPPEWEYWKFREKTFVDTSSMWNVEAVRAVGGWGVKQPKLDDWYLSLKLTQVGWTGKKSKAISLITEHNERRSRNNDTHDALWNARSIGVVTLWGNKSKCHDELLDWYANAEFPEQTSIYWVDNSDDPVLSEKLWNTAQRIRHNFKAFTIIPIANHYILKEGQTSKASERHQHVANLYNIVMPKVSDDLVLIVEDDNLPGLNDLRKLSNILTPWSKIAAVGAAYRSRTAPAICCASKNMDAWMNCPKFDDLPEGPMRVGMIGGGFTLYSNSVLKRIFPFECKMHQMNKTLIGWDGNVGRKMTKLGYQVILHGGVKIKHLCDEVIEWETKYELHKRLCKQERGNMEENIDTTVCK